MKRLFVSIGVRIHLCKKSVQQPTDYRSLAKHKNYLSTTIDIDQRSKEIRSSPMTFKVFHHRQSVNSTISNWSTVPIHFRQQQRQPQEQQQPIAHTSTSDVTYFLQKISIV